MEIKSELKFSKEHEWVLYKTETNSAVVGITDFAQQSLGDIVYVDLPKIGVQCNAHQVVGSVESVKSVSDIFSPLSGEVIAINENVNNTPEIINQDPYQKGWMFEIKLNKHNELNDLLSHEEYQKNIL